MDERTRQGVGLVCIALICALLVQVFGDAPVSEALRALAYLVGIAGLALAAFGLLRPSA